jgi:hypothetical protein
VSQQLTQLLLCSIVVNGVVAAVSEHGVEAVLPTSCVVPVQAILQRGLQQCTLQLPLSAHTVPTSVTAGCTVSVQLYCESDVQHAKLQIIKAQLPELHHHIYQTQDPQVRMQLVPSLGSL